MILKEDFYSGCTFLDNAATTLKPKVVVSEYIDYFYKKPDVEKVRDRVAKFIGTDSSKIKFTRGTTNSLNKIASFYRGKISSVSLPISSHHSNLLPWQRIANLNFVDVDNKGELGEFSQADLVTVDHVSNVLGTINPVKEIAKKAKLQKSIVVVDGAQAPSHLKVNVEELGCDFYTFSSHKMYGPTGLGILYDKNNVIEEDYYNYKAIASFYKALEYLENNFDKVKNEKILASYLSQGLKGLGVKVFGGDNRVGIFSFAIEGVHPHDIATFLNSHGIAVRAGHHCAQPLMKFLGVNATSRASLGIYNDKEDVDKFLDSLFN